MRVSTIVMGGHHSPLRGPSYLSQKVARWWLPDDVVFIEQMPMTTTGKIHKLTLRERFKDYKLAETAGAHDRSNA